MTDAEEFREASRRRWEESAAGWEERRATFQRDAQPVSVWLVEHIEPQPGYRVLELAAGVGDTGLLAAELVQPGGSVVITDGAEAMVEAARRRAEEVGARNVECRQMEAEWIDLPTASVDGVLCRWGYMLLADPEAALRETRRALRPGGRVALAAWAQAEHNPWFTVVGRSLADLDLVEPPEPGEPGPFAFADEGRIETLLEDAGFDEILVEPLDFAMRLESPDEYFEHQRSLSTRLRETLAGLSPADHTRLRDAIDEALEPYVRAGGSVELPARTWVAAALA
ncbi:MAG TPA: methyltransferase domain-containing protein [Solirubrobacteraceae bacterium]|nr:methyltransferase domain-containing protein [Solirubrobacteraceae bacterium]